MVGRSYNRNSQCLFFSAGQSRLVFVGQGNTKTHAQSNGETDEEDDESAPPLETTRAAGVLDTLADLLVTLLDVLDCTLGVNLGGNNNVLLLLDHRGELLEENGELRESLLDALELVVASAHVTKEKKQRDQSGWCEAAKSLVSANHTLIHSPKQATT